MPLSIAILGPCPDLASTHAAAGFDYWFGSSAVGAIDNSLPAAVTDIVPIAGAPAIVGWTSYPLDDLEATKATTGQFQGFWHRGIMNISGRGINA
jgi:hypothetical protein